MHVYNVLLRFHSLKSLIVLQILPLLPKMQSESKIPVFVFPNSMTFLMEDKTTHKRILSLYNPYDYTIKYRGKDFSH